MYLCQGTTRINERVSNMFTHDGDLIREGARVNGLIHINSISPDLSLKTNIYTWSFCNLIKKKKNIKTVFQIFPFFPLGVILRAIGKLLSNDLYFFRKQGKDTEEEG